jgi:DNA invertase Pin-like site-specific DNA recombinase
MATVNDTQQVTITVKKGTGAPPAHGRGWLVPGYGHRLRGEAIDTIPGGKLILHVFAALAEFERDLIREPTQAGLRATRKRGRLGERPRKLDAKQRTLAQEPYDDGETDIATICKSLGVSRATLYRSLERIPDRE